MRQYHTVTWVGGGLQIGIQKKISKLRVDWTILGIGLSNMSFKGRINVMNASENFDLRNFDTSAGDAKLAFEKHFPLQKSVEAQAILLQGKGLMPMLRMGVAIGICY